MAQVVPVKHTCLQDDTATTKPLGPTHPGADELITYSAANQWQLIGENGRLLRCTHAVGSAVDCIAVVVGMF